MANLLNQKGTPKRLRCLLMIGLVASMLVLTPAAAVGGAPTWVSEPLNPATQSTSTNGGLSPSISADGRIVAFQSQSTELSPAVTDTNIDVFVRDLATGQLTAPSQSPFFQNCCAGDHHLNPVVSGSGEWIAWQIDGGHIGAVNRATGAEHQYQRNPGSLAGISDSGEAVLQTVQGAYVLNLATGAIEDLSQAYPLAIADQGKLYSNSADGPDSMSSDGRYVAAKFKEIGSPSRFSDRVAVIDRVNGTIDALVPLVQHSSDFIFEATVDTSGRYILYWIGRDFGVSLPSYEANTLKLHDRLSGSTTIIADANNPGGQPRLIPGALSSGASSVVFSTNAGHTTFKWTPTTGVIQVADYAAFAWASEAGFGVYMTSDSLLAEDVNTVSDVYVLDAPIFDLVAPVVDGTPDGSGWHNTPQSITWTATDPQPSAGFTDNNPPNTIADTEGTHTYLSEEICDVVGNCSNGTVTLSIDTVAPTLNLLAPANGASIPIADYVAANCTASDAVSGLNGVCTLEEQTTAIGGQIAYVITATATDVAGNVSVETRSFTVVLDTQAPTISFTTNTDANAAGWWNQPVVHTFSCLDSQSGIASCPAPVTVSSEGANQAFMVNATDNVGNVGELVVSGVNIDLTAPAGSFTGFDSSYDVDEFIDIGCASNDALSGVASTTCVGAAGPAYDFVGSNTVTLTVVDVAGNTSVFDAVFVVGVDAGSVDNLIDQFVTKANTVNQLQHHLERVVDATTAVERQSALTTFINVVNAKTGKDGLTVAEANVLIALVSSHIF